MPKVDCFFLCDCYKVLWRTTSAMHNQKWWLGGHGDEHGDGQHTHVFEPSTN